MQKKYFPAITMLTAGAVTCIVSIANNMDKLLSLEILLGVLIAFYIIGLIARGIITKVIEFGGIKEEEESDVVVDATEENDISQEEDARPED